LVNIFEISPPSKISGLSSLVVQFDYNQYIVDALKTIPTSYFHKKDKVWEVPICYLGRLLDNLTFLDDITLKLLDTPESEQFRIHRNYELAPLSDTEKTSFKLIPFKHQLEAVDFGLIHEKWLLLDSPGTGKTFSTICLAETLKRRGLIDHCFIVCGINALKQNWKKEINKFSTESAVILGEYTTRTGTTRYRSVEKRAQQLLNPIEEFFIITNIETLRDNRIVEAFKKSENKFGLIAVDEIHKAAGSKSAQQTTNLLKLDAPFKLGMTGSLIVNSPVSAYSSLVFTENDNSTLTNFKSLYCSWGGYNNTQITGYKNLEVLQEEIQACSLRRTLNDVREDLPPLTVDVEYLEMDDDQQKFYEAIREGVKEEADKVELKSGNLLALTTRLRQATACPSVLTTQNIDSVKVERAFELIEEITAQGEKVVVFSMFKEPLNQLAAKLEKFRFSINTGDTSDFELSNNVDRFQEDPSEQVFLGSYARAGTGLTLNSSMYMICIDTPYTYALFNQAQQRIHRVNNQRPAYIKVLVCSDTIDERVQEIVETKRELGEYLVDGIEFDVVANTKLDDALRDIIKNL
jgi:SNF2 family DNA or RNA helicase